jgi:hypothetical protein
MPIGVDPRYAGGLVGLGSPEMFQLRQPAAPDDDPAFFDTLAAAARQATLPGAAYTRLSNLDPEIDTPANYDPLDDIAGFEDRAGLFVGADSKSDVEGIKSRLRKQDADREVLRRSGGVGTASEIGLSIFDPSMLVAFAVPELAAAKGVQLSRAATGAIEGLAAAGVYESGLQALQEDRTALQTALTLGGATILGGALGALLRRTPAAERDALARGIDDAAANPARSEVGAASSTAPTTLELEAPARGVKGLLKAASAIPGTKTDMQVIFESPSLRAQQTLEELAEVPILKAKNTEEKGFIPTSADSVESRAIRTDATLANFRDAIKSGYAEYRAAGGRLKLTEFEAEISKAARREDVSSIPQVGPLAKKLRAEIFDPSADEAKALGILDDPVRKDQERLAKREVDKYFKAESGQLFSDFKARTLIEARKRIGAERKAAIERERAASEQTLSKVKQTLDQAEAAYKAERAAIREQFEQPEGWQYTRDEIRSKRSAMRKARTKLQRVRNAERRERVAETKRLNEVRGKLKRQAERDLKSAKPSRKRFERLSRKGDQSDPALTRLADLTRKRDSGRLTDVVQVPKSKLTGKEVVGAKSYFRRMYDRDAIRAKRSLWNETLVTHFVRQGVDELEARAAVEDITRKIIGTDAGQANFNIKVSVPEAGPLQGRTLDIQDELIEQFLVNDPVKVAKAYLRDMVPQIEMVRRFGDRDMKARLDEIGDDFNILRERVRQSTPDQDKQSKALSKLDDQEKVAKNALLRVRDRILGKATKAPQTEGGRRIVDVVRAWRSLVGAARLGTTALVSVPQDLARISSQYGFFPTMGNLVKLTTSSDFRAMAKATARRAGSAVEVALARRVQDAFDGAVTEGWANTLAQSVYKYTGLNHWMDFSRTLNATLLEDRALKVARQLADGEPAKAFDRTRLAQLGLGDKELKAIAAQVDKHGGEIDGLRTSGSGLWDDGNIARIYDAAILKESRQNVLQPGAANRVWWMDSELGKTIGQLKTFSLASANAYSGAIAGAIGQREYAYAARFIGFMMIGGGLAHSLRSLAADTELPSTPGQFASLAIQQSGLLGVLPDIISPVGRMLTRVGENVGALEPDSALSAAFGGSSRYSDRNPISALGGPALGAGVDLWDIAFNRIDNGLSADDVHAIRRLLPFQNVWYLRRAINALEGELSEGITGVPAE